MQKRLSTLFKYNITCRNRLRQQIQYNFSDEIRKKYDYLFSNGLLKYFSQIKEEKGSIYFENESILKENLKQIQDCEDLISESETELQKLTDQEEIKRLKEDIKFYKEEQIQILESNSYNQQILKKKIKELSVMYSKDKKNNYVKI